MALRTAVLLAAGLVAASGCTGDSGNEDTIGVTGQLALVTDLEPVQQDLLTRASAVFLADAGGEDSRRLTEPRSALDEVGSVAWSPDGTRIAYTTGESPGADLFVANADGTDPRKLTSFPSPAAARLPVWSPDGGRIAFYEFDDGGTAI